MSQCSFEGCDRDASKKQLCKAHYQQQWRGEELRPVKERQTHCDFEGCDRPHLSMGWCSTHYAQSRTGREMFPIGQRKVASLSDILAECVPDGECLIYKPHRKGKYRNTTHGGRKVIIHRLAYELATGEDLTGVTIHHKCANSRCINPDHLQKATHADNVLEMLARKDYESRIAALEARVMQLEAELEKVKQGVMV